MTVAPAPTMTTVSSTTAPSVMTMETKETRLEDAIHKLQANLTRYARANDRRMVLRSLKDVRFLNFLSLENHQDEEPQEHNLQDLQDEVAKESFVLNGVVFHSKVPCTHILQELCQSLSSSPTLYKSLLERLARSVVSADSFFRLNAIMGSPDLMLMPIPATSPAAIHVPIELDIYSHDQQVHATIAMTHSYGLYRKSDMKHQSRPWIALQAIVHERINLTTGARVRSMRVKLPDLYY